MEHTFRYLVERDADFAIISAFEKNSKVRKLFLEGYRELDAKIIETRHSYMQQEENYGYGESDIIFIMEDSNGRFAIFIEDKIKANAQPNQSERYKDRADSLKLAAELSDTRIFLCAPKSYLDGDSKNTEGYEHTVSYEDICNNLSESLEKDVLSKAAENKACAVTDVGVTTFWNKLREYINENYNNKLQMKGKAGNKTSGAQWQEFETGIKNCLLYIKINSRKVELEFLQMGQYKDAFNVKLAELNIPQSIRTNKGKSKSVSIQLDIEEQYGLSFYSPFESQIENINIWISKMLELMKYVDILKNHGFKSFPIRIS